MGGFQSKSKSDTINWNGLKTDNMSSTMPGLKNLSREANELIASLDIPGASETSVSEFSLDNILGKSLNNVSYNASHNTSGTNNINEQLSETSPFISSEMYNYLVKNNGDDPTDQNGGGKKKKKGSRKHMKGGMIEDDSSTSSTSSDSDLNDILDSDDNAKMGKKDDKKKKHNKHKGEKDDSDSDFSGGNLSYLSSSAHTDREFSDSNSSSDSDVPKPVLGKNKGSHRQKQKTVISSTESSNHGSDSSLADENGMMATTVSVNTDDINMVSEY